jgi:membrane-associated protease RseP (regulator of RpoE activity)
MLSLASSILAAFVAGWIALLFHELGHAAAAQAVGVRIWGMRLGMGPTMWRGSVNGKQIQICALPVLGTVTLLDADADAIGYRDVVSGRWRFEWGPGAWRAPIISAAGGLSNILAMLIFLTAWQIAGPTGGDPFAHDVLRFGIAANFAGYLNLLPCSRSDGWHLLAHFHAARAFAGLLPAR